MNWFESFDTPVLEFNGQVILGFDIVIVSVYQCEGTVRSRGHFRDQVETLNECEQVLVV